MLPPSPPASWDARCAGHPSILARRQNYVKNSLRVFNEGTAVKLWEYLEGVKEDMMKEKGAAESPETPAAEPGTSEAPSKKGVSRCGA